MAGRTSDTAVTGAGRRFLFLQGPHGPFFNRLGRMIRCAGGEVWRVGFNRGDAFFWSDRARYVAYTGTVEDWPDSLSELLDRHAITDIVLYGDTRPVHAAAVEIARRRGLRVHVFEEGYMRPYWVTYERDGANGNSRLMDLTVAQMRRALKRCDTDQPDAPAHWGDMREHIFYGALYHFFVLLANRRYRHFRPHRSLTVLQEFMLYIRKLWALPLIYAERAIAQFRIRNAGFPYHVVLLQLAHDSSFVAHGPFRDMESFLDLCMHEFAEGAPPHHHLVFKAHPLEDGRVPIRRILKRLARLHGLDGRVHYLRGGKLARLLDHARSAVTVNSTAAQQVLWRGMPLKVFGRAVYAKPEFVSQQPLAAFFARPARPDARAYRDYRRFLLETSQVPGGFYSIRGRRMVLRQVVDMMLADEDPYTALARGSAAPRQQLQLVR